MGSICSKRLPIVPLLIAGPIIFGLRSLKDLDKLAITLVDACQPIVYASPTKRRPYLNNMSAFCHLIHRI